MHQTCTRPCSSPVPNSSQFSYSTNRCSDIHGTSTKNLMQAPEWLKSLISQYESDRQNGFKTAQPHKDQNQAQIDTITYINALSFYRPPNTASTVITCTSRPCSSPSSKFLPNSSCNTNRCSNVHGTSDKNLMQAPEWLESLNSQCESDRNQKPKCKETKGPPKLTTTNATHAMTLLAPIW